jgi:hypothetical protein
VEWLRKGKVFFFYKFIMGGRVGWKWLFPKELDILELKKDNKKPTIVRGPGLDAGKDLHEKEL